MVGFMRRYDDGYRAMKAAIDSGEIGAPLMFHSGHRNPSVPGHYTSDMVIIDTCVHDIDVSRWLLDAEVVAAQVLSRAGTARGREHLQDPLLFIFEMANGALVDVEAAVNIDYGYDIRGEVRRRDRHHRAGRDAARSSSSARASTAGRVPEDWRERFLRAYDIEFQEWIDAVAAGTVDRPQLVGRLRRHGGLRRGRRGAPHRRAGRRCRCASSRTCTGRRPSPARRARTDDMVKIALDPAMYHADLSVADEVRKAADLGYEYLELSPRADWFFWHRYPKADDAAIAERQEGRRGDRGQRSQSLVPVFNWSSPDEQERRAQVRNWKRLLEIADELECRPIVSELSGDPNRPAALRARLLRVDGGADPGLRAVRHRAEPRGAPVRLLRDATTTPCRSSAASTGRG